MTNDHDPTGNRRDDSEEEIEDEGNRASQAASVAKAERWLTGNHVLDATLPDDVAVLLGRLLGNDPVETLGEWVLEVRRHTGGGSIDVEDLCHTDAASPHRGQVAGETYGFRCFYDAVILAALRDEPVDIRTESPSGTLIRATAAGTADLHVTPPTSIFSFGVDESVDPPGPNGPSTGDVYSAICPYVKAFPDSASYANWAETVPAATVALPLSGATDVAEALVA